MCSLSSTRMGENLSLSTTKHLSLKISNGWINKGRFQYQLRGTKMMVPMETIPILLWMLWQFDRWVTQNAYTYRYSIVMNDKNITLTTLTCKKTHDDLVQLGAEYELKKNDKKGDRAKQWEWYEQNKSG